MREPVKSRLSVCGRFIIIGLDSLGARYKLQTDICVPSGIIDVLHNLRARACDPSMNLLFATHPHPQERLTQLGDALAPQMGKLPSGQEPPLHGAAVPWTEYSAASWGADGRSVKLQPGSARQPYCVQLP